MIRDEFKQQQDKDLSLKDVVGIRNMGERAYYISTLNKTNALIKNLHFTTISMMVMSVILTALLVFVGIEMGIGSSWYSIFGLIFDIAIWLWSIVWLVVYRPYLKRKLHKFQDYMDNFTNREIAKQKSIYDKLNNN